MLTGGSLGLLMFAGLRMRGVGGLCLGAVMNIRFSKAFCN